MGINLPVYVLFTKMDRLPFFTEFVRNLTNEEATQVLGVTLPMLLTRRSEGVYAEEETARLTGNFERLFRSLADARPEFLARETRRHQAARRLRVPARVPQDPPAVVQFLVDLCRPSQLSVGPVPARLLLHRRAAHHHQRSRAGGCRRAAAAGRLRRGRRRHRHLQRRRAGPKPRRPRAPRRWAHAQSAAVALPEPLVQRRSAGRPRRHGRQRRPASRPARAPHAVLAAAAALCLLLLDRVHAFRSSTIAAWKRACATPRRASPPPNRRAPTWPRSTRLRKLESAAPVARNAGAVPPRRRAVGAIAGSSTPATISIPKRGAFISTASANCCFAQTQGTILQSPARPAGHARDPSTAPPTTR